MKYSIVPKQFFVTILAGILGGTLFWLASRLVISLFQIGAAPVIPEAKFWLIGVLSLLPTQTATKYEGVNPIVQLSLLLSVVPVLTDTTLPGILSGELEPNSKDLALLSAKILERI